MNKKERQLAYERERKAMNDLAMREFDRERAIEAIHKQHIETIQEQIDGFYMRYAGSEGLTRSEAMKRADQMDVTKFANKAKKAVKEKDFSPETNEWLKMYNLKMKVSRLELLKEEINWELIQMYDKDYQLISESLREEARLELERQAGILGNSAKGAVKRIEGIVNADFYGKNFSERVWGRTGLYQSTQKEVLKSLNGIYATMDGYRRERNRLMERMGTTEYETMRLLRTENARIGSQTQVEAYKENGFTHFIYVAEPGACDICGPLDGKIFPVSEAQIGLNLKPLHPNCRCSSHGYIAMERFVDGKWVDDYTGEEINGPEIEDIRKEIANLESVNDRLKKELSYEEKIDSVRNDIQTEKENSSVTGSKKARRKELDELEELYEDDEITTSQYNEELKRIKAKYAGSGKNERLEELREELKRLEDEYTKAKEAHTYQNANDVRGVLSKYRDFGSDGIDFDGHLEGGSSKVADKIKQAYDYYPSDWVKNSVDYGSIEVGFEKRGYYQHRDGNSILVLSGQTGSKNSFRTAIHELGHRQEYINEAIRKAEKEFYLRRTEGEKLVRMKDISPNAGFSAKEVTRVDNFIDPYMGLDYGDDEAYELFSMGMDTLMTEPTKLAEGDPDMFNWLVDILLTM